MTTVLTKLKNWGCDVDGAMERFMGDEELYASCLQAVVNDKAYGALYDALMENNCQKAFDSAHTLKGVLANMGLTPMYQIVVEIVEPLRAGNMENLLPKYEILVGANEQLRSIIENQ